MNNINYMPKKVKNIESTANTISKKTIKLEELEQIDGRVEKLIPSTRLDVLLGADGMGKYGTLDKIEYIKQLDGYNVAELRNHAIHAGLIPSNDVNRLKRQLLIDFDKYVLAFKAPTKVSTRVISSEKAKLGLEIMSAVK